MLSCPAGNIFLGSIDTTGNKKTKAYIATELKKFIEDVGPRFVTQICTDNAMNMLEAMDDIVTTYPHISKQGCAAHALDLMLEIGQKLTNSRTRFRRRSVCVFICATIT
jgi:pyruvate-formate lyase